MKKLLFTSIFLMFSFRLYAQEVPFNLEITNIRNNQGHIIVGICAGSKEFTGSNTCRYLFSMPATKGTIIKDLNIVKGSYAILVFHDENDNQKLDTAMFGKPTEYYGFSNNTYGPYGTKPEYNAAVINIDGHSNAVIKLRK